MKKIISELSYIISQFDFSQIDLILSEFENNVENNYVGFGAGRMGYSLRAFIMRLDHLGFKSFMIGDTNFPNLDSNTTVFINSSSGETETNILYVKQAIKFKARTTLFTSNKDSTLASICDNTIIYPQIKSHQLMKTHYEQFTFLLFDYICGLLVDKLKLDINKIENNHSISE